MSEPITVLNGAVAENGLSVRIEDRGLVGQITLRGDHANAALAKAVEEVAGVAVPAPLTANFNGDHGAVWMSPDELLLFVAYADAPATAARLSEMLAEVHHMAVNVSDTRTVLRVSGEGARELMAKGAPVDVSDAAFPVGTARRTHFAEIAVGMWRLEGDVWEMVCFQSYARHLFDWLSASSHQGARVNYF
ncbi:sarcosine oxidase subunit gamma [Rhodobacteraceae bacterium NNCM2]|nr:sarcosine oxidase subunit gamma [Coraliihabitans acroporae]